MNKAFVLGAGFGTRLRPLTEVLPKPLIPVANKPLITYAFDLLRDAGVREFVVNTHHLAKAYGSAFPRFKYGDLPIHLVHETPEILDTGGGLANAAKFFRHDHFVVYNGDILTDLPVAKAMDAHRKSGNLATLILRSGGPNRNAALDPKTGKMVDLRNALNSDSKDLYQFTGIYIVDPDFLRMLQPVPQSVVPAFLSAIRDHNRLGGIVIDEGYWWDLGNRDAYTEASFVTLAHDFPRFEMMTPPVRIHQDTRINPDSEIDEFTTIGEGCVIGAGVVLKKSILWPGTRVAAGSELENCIATGVKNPILGSYNREDL
ncbi:MAG: sugar phosphate nucleotidyltransferase [Verrucomicrobiota bacterium]